LFLTVISLFSHFSFWSECLTDPFFSLLNTVLYTAHKIMCRTQRHSHGCWVSIAEVSYCRSRSTMRLSGMLPLNGPSCYELLKQALLLQTIAKPSTHNAERVRTSYSSLTSGEVSVTRTRRLTVSSCSIMYHILHISYSKLKHYSPVYDCVYNRVHRAYEINKTCWNNVHCTDRWSMKLPVSSWNMNMNSFQLNKICFCYDEIKLGIKHCKRFQLQIRMYWFVIYMSA
jgi:hypothetical protein